MPTNIPSVRSRGFSLIEVLVAVVVMSIGLLALASLQLNVIRASGEAKTAATAASIAKDQIEALRSFTTVEPGYRNINSTTWAAVTNSGGLGGVSFESQQTVSRYVYDKATSTFLSKGNTLTDAQILAGCAQCLTGKDFKRVQVDVRWTDAAGVVRVISMEDLIDSLEPVESAKVVKTNVGSAPRAVKVIIVNPGSVGGVIPIAIGDGTSTAASNPTPEVKGNSNTVSETRFDVFTYSAINGATAQAESRVETTVMHCTCSTANAPNDNTARGYRPTYWNGFRYAPPTLTSYVPPAGWTGVSTESLLCDACCRDHNDPNNVSGPKFDPWRTAGHHHYRRVDAATLTLADSGTYDEACRLIRVDGIWRVAADLRDDYFAMLETNNSGNLNDADQNARPYAPTTAAKDRYEDFVLDYLDDRIANNNVSSTYNTASAGTYPLDSGSYESTYQLNNPTSAIQMQPTAVAESSESKWLHTRGLFIDYLEPDAITAITDARSNCPDSSTQALRAACVLPYMPFTSINLTELADWQVGTSNPQSIVQFQVANNAFYDPTNSNKPTRGNVYKGTNPTNNSTASIYANLSESNAGVALFKYTIDNDEQANYVSNSPSKGHDSQPFQIGGGGGGGGTPFTVNISGQANSTPYPTIGSNLDATTCNASGTPNPYICGITPAGGGNMALKVTGYTKATTLTVPNGCRNSGTTAMPIINDYNLATATNTTQAVAAISITPTNNAAINDQTVVIFGPVNNNDVLTMTFTGPTRYCPSNYAVQANGNSSGLNCSGNGSNAAPTWSTSYVTCPNGTP
jgi:type IV pilus modification protein PilV